jgi:hypothetical protein
MINWPLIEKTHIFQVASSNMNFKFLYIWTEINLAEEEKGKKILW